MKPKNAIQFNWEKYQSGKYNVICRDGVKPSRVEYWPESAPPYKIIACCDGICQSYTTKGEWNDNYNHNYDLLLVPKKANKKRGKK